MNKNEKVQKNLFACSMLAHVYVPALFANIFDQFVVVNQSKTNSHISYCVTAKSHIIHMDTHEHHLISPSLTHVPLLS